MKIHPYTYAGLNTSGVKSLPFTLYRVCEDHGITLEEIKGKCRKAHLVKARVDFVERTYKDYSFKEIASHINRDRTSALHYISTRSPDRLDKVFVDKRQEKIVELDCKVDFARLLQCLNSLNDRELNAKITKHVQGEYSAMLSCIVAKLKLKYKTKTIAHYTGLSYSMVNSRNVLYYSDADVRAYEIELREEFKKRFGLDY